MTSSLPTKPESGGSPAIKIAVAKNRAPTSGAWGISGPGFRRSDSSPRPRAMRSASRKRAPADEDAGTGGQRVPAYVEREFLRHLECGIVAHAFARLRRFTYG